MKLKLWLDCDKCLTLSRSEFQNNPSAPIYSSIRGRSAPSFMNLGTFGWSPAVKAATLLLLKFASKGALQNSEREPVTISGLAGSPASSLDYAIDKAPLWLQDMFGTDARGEPMARRLFCRLNPGRRRSGPVVVCMNSNLIKPDSVIVYLNAIVLQPSTTAFSQLLTDLACVVEGSKRCQEFSQESAPRQYA